MSYKYNNSKNYDSFPDSLKLIQKRTTDDRKNNMRILLAKCNFCR